MGGEFASELHLFGRLFHLGGRVAEEEGSWSGYGEKVREGNCCCGTQLESHRVVVSKLVPREPGAHESNHWKGKFQPARRALTSRPGAQIGGVGWDVGEFGIPPLLAVSGVELAFDWSRRLRWQIDKSD